VLAMIERQHGQVGGLPDQDWSLRVTLVCGREGSDWRLIHRQADPLVQAMDPELAVALARRRTSGASVRCQVAIAVLRQR
jgi:hypothetical protein